LIKSLQNLIRYSYWKLFYYIKGYTVSKYYFSQSGEDHILSKIFEKKIERNEKGFYVDIGAYHPYKLSNTFYFYLQGWRGINVDPSPGSMKVFNKIRKDDLNIEIGISERGKGFEIPFYDLGNSPMSSFKLDWLNQNSINLDSCTIHYVKTYTLIELFEKYLSNDQKIDFLNIDAEGMSDQVYRSNNWNIYRPKILIIEMEGRYLPDIKNEIKYFEKINYNMIAKTTLNSPVSSVIFVDDYINFKDL